MAPLRKRFWRGPPPCRYCCPPATLTPLDYPWLEGVLCRTSNSELGECWPLFRDGPVVQCETGNGRFLEWPEIVGPAHQPTPYQLLQSVFNKDANKKQRGETGQHSVKPANSKKKSYSPQDTYRGHVKTCPLYVASFIFLCGNSGGVLQE